MNEAFVIKYSHCQNLSIILLSMISTQTMRGSKLLSRFCNQQWKFTAKYKQVFFCNCHLSVGVMLSARSTTNAYVLFGCWLVLWRDRPATGVCVDSSQLGDNFCVCRAAILEIAADKVKTFGLLSEDFPTARIRLRRVFCIVESSGELGCGATSTVRLTYHGQLDCVAVKCFTVAGGDRGKERIKNK